MLGHVKNRNYPPMKSEKKQQKNNLKKVLDF